MSHKNKDWGAGCSLISIMAWYQPKLHEVVMLNDDSSTLDEIVALIKAGHDVNRQDHSCRTPLDYCVSLHGVYSDYDEQSSLPRLKKAKTLLENGADPNIADKCGWTVMHQCAQNGDLPLLQLVVRKGGNVKLRNHQNQLPVDLAAIRRHAHIVKYLEIQSCDLRSLCRVAIRDAMGKRTYNRITELPLPSMLKLFVNYGNPFQGCEMTVIPQTTWTPEDMQEGLVGADQLREFIRSNASADFLQEHSDVINGTSVKDLISVFQTMFLWEAFRAVSYEEPLARAPRYSLERIVREEEEEDRTSGDRWNLKSMIEKLKAISPY